MEPVHKQAQDRKCIQSSKDDNKNNYKNTNKRKQSESHQGPPVDEISRKNSKNLLDQIEPRQKLLHNLVDGVYQDGFFYPPPKDGVSMEKLEHEAYFGMMPKSDFLELLSQILIKHLSKIYKKTREQKNMTPFIGSYSKAMDEFEILLKNTNGSTPTKKVALANFENLNWRINFAVKYFKNTDHFCLFPGEYLNPTRTTKKEGGFAYTQVFLKRHQESKAYRGKIKKRRAAQIEAAKIRKTKTEAISLVESKIQKFISGRWSLNDLHDYVSNNSHIPKEVKNQVPDLIQRAYRQKHTSWN